MQADTRVLRTATTTAVATVMLLVAGRVIARSLEQPTPSATGATVTASSALSTNPTPGPVPSPRHGRLVATGAARPRWSTYVDPVDHVSVSIPAGWSVKPDPIPQLTYPDLVLAVGSWPFPIGRGSSCAPADALRALPRDGALLWLLESRPTSDTGLFNAAAFPTRPGSFELPGPGQPSDECGAQVEVRFREAGRYFWVGIALGPRAPSSRRAVVRQILQRLRPI